MRLNKKGFTLIELLVVIAIIGILSSIVLIALRGARDKAKDARIQASLAQIRVLAEIVYDGIDYDGFDVDQDGTWDYADYVTLATDIAAQGGTVTANQSGDLYCVQSTLNGGGSWCVDSTGYAGAVANCDALADSFDCAAD